MLRIKGRAVSSAHIHLRISVMRILITVLALAIGTQLAATPVAHPTSAYEQPSLHLAQAKPGNEEEYKKKKAELDKLLKEKEAFLKEHLSEDANRAMLDEAEVVYFAYVRARDILAIPWPYKEREFPEAKTEEEKKKQQAARERQKREKQIITRLVKIFLESLDLGKIKPATGQMGEKLGRYLTLLIKITDCQRALAKLSR
ncbi:MAG: hypothetical protein AAGP08_06125 [Pseudomonadota bacterium]